MDEQSDGSVLSWASWISRVDNIVESYGISNSVATSFDFIDAYQRQMKPEAAAMQALEHLLMNNGESHK